MTKVLFIGYLGRGQTSGMRCDALRRLGYAVEAVDAGEVWRGASYIERQLGQRTSRSLRIDQFNDRVIEAAKSHPAVVWAEKQEYLRPSTLQALQADGATCIHYNPDPYFSISWKQTPLADGCLPLYDVLAVTKRYELEAYRRVSRGEVCYSIQGFDPIKHVAPPLRHTDSGNEVVFVGGWEPRRERLVEAAMKKSRGVGVWGYGWRVAQSTKLNPLRALRLGRLSPGERLYFGDRHPSIASAIRPGEGASGEIYEEHYADVVSSSRIALGLLRELCPDEHTTRTFEIPAMGGFMLADRSAEHEELFAEGREAEFFGCDEEFAEKLDYYLGNETARSRIAQAGHDRCISSGYSYDDRIRTIMTTIGVHP